MIAWLLEAFVTTTILLLLVLALRGPVARAFGAGWAYALWAVPAVRLVLPPLPQLTPGIQLPTAAAFVPAAAVGGTAPLPATAGPIDWAPLILALWAGGAVIFLASQWLSYRAFARRLDASARPARPPHQDGIAAVVSAAVDGPLAMGLLHPRIVLPEDFERRYSPAERRLALAHEVTHHRRRDIWWNLAATLVLAFNWFNPVAWIAHRAFRADQELSCDAAVAASASADERCDYARALVKSASRTGLIAACALNGADQLKQRLRMMAGHRVSGWRRAGGLAALSMVALTGFAVGSPGVSEAAKEAPRPIQVASAAAAVTPSPLASQQAVATKTRSVKPRSTPRRVEAAIRRHSKAAPPVAPMDVAALPAMPEAAPPPEPPIRELRLVRVSREEIRTGGSDGAPVARVLIIRAQMVPQAPLPPEIARAIKAARAGDTRIAATGDSIRRFQIMLNSSDQGE
ncbi:MAG TPA: M56 family metallopeptidase [Allosphingosinicella sp.]|jgi:beta-lactamase regulating signal transducer with metallopeptidase domain